MIAAHLKVNKVFGFGVQVAAMPTNLGLSFPHFFSAAAFASSKGVLRSYGSKNASHLVGLRWHAQSFGPYFPA